MLNESLDVINKRLSDIYGEDITGRPKYRIIKADDEFENRRGIYRDYVDEKCTILLREVEEVRLVHKYPAFLGYHILEKRVYVPREMWDIKDHNGYECLWLFRDKQGNPQELYWRAIKFLVDSNVKNYKQTMSEFMEEVKKVEKTEMEYFMDYLDNESPYLATMLNNKEAIVVPGVEK